MRRGRLGWRLLAMASGALVAALPALAAAEEGARELDPPADAEKVVLLLVLAIAGSFVLTSIGYLYRRQRGLRWDYQLPHGVLSEGAAHADDEGGH